MLLIQQSKKPSLRPVPIWGLMLGSHYLVECDCQVWVLSCTEEKDNLTGSNFTLERHPIV